MVVIAGDIPSHYYGRHPHQEFNLHQDATSSRVYRPFCKRVYRVDRAADLPRVVERAFHLSHRSAPGLSWSRTDGLFFRRPCRSMPSHKVPATSPADPRRVA
jgi:hypothetical protein